MDLENRMQEADHVKTNDETIAPGYLNTSDKNRHPKVDPRDFEGVVFDTQAQQGGSLLSF